MTRRRSTGALGLAVAVAVHGGLLAWLFVGSPPAPPAPKPRVVTKVKLAARPPVEEPKPVEAPPAPKPVEIAKAPEIRARPKPAPGPIEPKSPPKSVETPRPVLEAPPQVAETKPAPPPPETPAPKPRRFTVSMDATVSSGGVAVPVSSNATSWAFGGAGGDVDGAATLPGAPSGPGVPAGTKAGAAAADASELSTWPRLAWQPDAENLRALYPEEARRDGREGTVALKLLVSTSGEVVSVRLVQPAGFGFDEVALQTVKRFRFEPGKKDGLVVAVWIPWNYRFRLDG